jgi:outer membrane protein TolC
MKRIILILFLLAATAASAQLTLKECTRLARENHPVAGQKQLYESIEKKQLTNLDAAYYPQLDLFGQAQYQSDVPEIPINPDIPNIDLDMPDIPHDQYKAGLSLNQIIWDGGAVSSQKDMTKIETGIKSAEIDSELLSVEQKVNEAYFTILALQQNRSIIELNITTLESKLESLQSAIRHGMALKSSANVIRAELLRLRQKVSELNSAIRTARHSLGELIGQDIPAETGIDLPAEPRIKGIIAEGASRPEYEMFDRTRKRLEESRSLVNSRIMPKFFAFGQAAYGKPGLDMFDPDFQPYYIVGIKMSWKFWDWSSSQREQEILSLRSNLIDTKEKSFRMNISIGAQRYIDRVENLNDLIEQDNEIIKLRQEVVDAASSKMDNGTITATEYITEFNSLMQAKMNLQTHRLELIRSKYEYLTFLGLSNIEQ